MNEKFAHMPEPLGVRSASECGQFWVEGRSSIGGDFNSGYVSFSGYFGSYGPHMFAAAPQLLEFAAEWLDRQGSDDNYMTAKARSAIARATGKTSEAA